MKLVFVLFLAACSTEAGSDCPGVPQPGQPCKANAICVYASGGNCSPTYQTKCVNGRFALVQGTVPPSCDASTDAPADGPADAPKDSAQDAPEGG